MKRTRCFSSFILLMLAALPIQLNAFGQVGHAVIGEIADERLTPEAKIRVNELLEGESLAHVASWADEIRGARGATSPFHYMNFPQDLERPEQEHLELEQGTIYMAIVHYTNVLIDENASEEQQQEALKFLVHFIGDLHQPLHVGLGEDRGGNSVRGTFFGDSTNLHRIWDSSIIVQEYGSTTPQNIELMLIMETAPEVVEEYAAETDLIEWIVDSRKVMNNGIYPGEEMGSFWVFDSNEPKTSSVKGRSFDFADHYQQKHLPTMKQQLVKGGARLAATLNSVFSESPASPFPELTIKLPDDGGSFKLPSLFPETESEPATLQTNGT